MAVLEWIAVGLRTDEINNRAASFDPPFSVSRQQVDFYRKSRKRDIDAILSVDENNALTSGLALKENRVKRLQQLASLMEVDLFGGFLWTEQVKGVGSGMMSTIVDYEEFNKAEVESYRGVLDDIAKEVGHRAIKQEHTVERELMDLLKGNQLSDHDRKALATLFPDMALPREGIEA